MWQRCYVPRCRYDDAHLLWRHALVAFLADAVAGYPPGEVGQEADLHTQEIQELRVALASAILLVCRVAGLAVECLMEARRLMAVGL